MAMCNSNNEYGKKGGINNVTNNNNMCVIIM
jgi:hypothetical protein